MNYRIRFAPYLYLSLVVGAIFLAGIAILPASNDLFVHAATLERLLSDFHNPRDPMVNEPGLGNPYFSPYMVFWAVVEKILSLDVFVVLRLAGVVNLVIFLSGFGAFVRTLSANNKVPVVALLCVFFLWGTRFFYWSGFVSFPSLVLSVAYPSTLAVGLGLWIWALLSKLLDRDNSFRKQLSIAILIAVAGAVVVLSHQFTALWICLYVAFYLLRNGLRLGIRELASLGLVGVIVVVAILWWPWYDLLASTGGVEGFNAVHEALYKDWIGRYLLLLLTIPAILQRLARDRADPLALTVITCFLVFVYGGLSGHYFLARIFPPVALLSQIAMAIAIVEGFKRGQRKVQRVYALVGCTALLAGLLFQSGSVNLFVPGSYPAALDKTFGSRMTKGDYEWLQEHVPFGDSVMTSNWDARAMSPAYGIFTVKTAWPDPFLGEKEQERSDDTGEFFRSKTDSDRRIQLMEKYDARWVIVTEKQAKLFENDHHFQWVATRPDTGAREENGAAGKQQLYAFVP